MRPPLKKSCDSCSEDRMTMHETCQWPPKKPCRQLPPGVNCAPIKEEYRLEYDYPQKPDFAIDHKEPIIIDWPPEKGQGDACEPDRGIREDLLMKIPDQIAPQVVTVHGTQADLSTTKNAAPPPVIMAERPHILHPDGSVHMQITPPHPVKPQIMIPDLGCAVRQPMRPWRQCIENTLVNDRVRRPMARWCHKRPMPPLVIPTCELQRLQDKVTERERMAAEKAARIRARECARLESRKRMGTWNYTVESLLEKKKDMQEAKELEESEKFKKLVADIKQSRDDHSAEWTARAKKLQLWGKGLIREFHAGMQLSKAMQEIEQSRNNKETDADLANEKTLPICDTKCMKAMIEMNERPEYPNKKERLKDRPINQKLLKTLQSIEIRQKEQEQEKKQQIEKTKKLLRDNLPDLPPVYWKHVKEPECTTITKEEKFKAAREELDKNIDDRLAQHEYIASHEEEVERQACEYRNFRLQKDKIRKDVEARLIRERVEMLQAKQAEAYRVLMEMEAKKSQTNRERSDQYNALKEKWEQEWQDKYDELRLGTGRRDQLVLEDYLKRKECQDCKIKKQGNYKYWRVERLCAEENYERECELKNERRKKAEEIQLYNQSLVSERVSQENRKKMIEAALAEKQKSQVFEEMQEMKNYAQDCIHDWVGKGRSAKPMHQAMKKWETDSGMHPALYRQYEEKKRQQECAAGGGDCCADGLALLLNSHNYVKKDKPAETTQSTGQRLGFCQ